MLREIETFSRTGGQAGRKIIERLEFDFPAEAEVKRLLLGKRTKARSNESVPEGSIIIESLDPTLGGSQRLQLPLDHTVEMIAQGTRLNNICPQFVALYTIRLDGRTRLALTEPRPAGDLQGPPVNHLMALFMDDETRTQIREFTRDAFGLYFVVDPTMMTQFRIRLSAREPSDFQEEQSLDPRARAFHADALDIDEASDGIKAFTGLIAAVMSADFRIMLIDEPEAFLHPPLARKLGYRLANLAATRQGNVLASTHSSAFVMGCIQSGKNVNIIRLTYANGLATARYLAADELQTMMRDPLLRSANILDALFHQGAIICEADSDRAFYQEVNERLINFNSEGARDSVFLNAQNKQTVSRIAGPLRDMGIPAAVIVDLDMIKKGGEFKALLKECAVPQALINSLGQLRGEVMVRFQARGLDPKTDGCQQLLGGERQAAESLRAQLAAYGIFLVPGGELESWLKPLGATGHGSNWLISMFERMGSDPDGPSYVKPGEGDVWDFVKAVGGWIADPNRLGMPTDALNAAEKQELVDVHDAAATASRG